MARGFKWSSLLMSLASCFLLASALGCGNPSPTAKPPNPASGKPKEQSKESKPPSPDPG